MKRISTDRGEYYRQLYIYTQRRNELRQLYPDWRFNPIYVKRAKKLTTKIRNYKRAMKRLDERNAKIREFNKRFREHYGFTLYKCNAWWNKEKHDSHKQMLRKFFCKYCIEQGITGTYISIFIGWKGTPEAATKRREINKQLQINKQCQTEWQTFKKVMKAGYHKIQTDGKSTNDAGRTPVIHRTVFQ